MTWSPWQKQKNSQMNAQDAWERLTSEYDFT